MFTLLLGPSKSGKSRLAEKFASQIRTGGLLYVATMIPVGVGEAGDARVVRHRAQREGMGFVTVECPVNLDEAPVQKEDAVLLEDVSNLLANNMFREENPRGMEQVTQDILSLASRCARLVVVSFSGVQQDPSYDAATNAYIAALEEINGRLAALAQTVVEVEGGIPTVRKGEFSLIEQPAYTENYTE